jgi:phytoene synthase
MDAFFISMEKDLNGDKYNTLEDTLGYIYGSASIVGLILAKILKLPTIAYPYAEKLGKSFQYINFIRDIYEDLELNRMYFPKEDLTRFKIKSLDCSSKDFDEGKFVIFMNYQIDRYEKWQKEAEKGFKYIPKQLLVPIRTASDVYKWTAKQIRKNPMLVYQKKIKPSGVRVWLTGIRNLWLEWR